jgi:CHAT domain-containing protein
LNTMPSRFEDYINNIVQNDAARRAYLKETFKITDDLLDIQMTENIVDKILALRIPNTVFLLFHLSQETGIAVVLDVESGEPVPFAISFGERQIRAVDEAYRSSARNPKEKIKALDAMISQYTTFLEPVLELLVPLLAGKHLKIFPRLQMNAVPIHAVRINGKYLSEHAAAISYGQTLGLFLKNHTETMTKSGAALRVILGNKVPWYKTIMPQIRDMYGGTLNESYDVSWKKILESIAARPATDTLFACHGDYKPEDLEASGLSLSADGVDQRVAFSRIFSELDLHGCRSVIMGACESGIVRSEIGAEYVGLPSAMLSSGVRYVIGAMWRIPQLATAILVERYLELITQLGADVSGSLCEAQREIMAITRDEVAAWIQRVMEAGAVRDRILSETERLDERPYSHPYFWAGLQVVGDV